MDLDEKAEEVLETLWINTEEGHQELTPISKIEEAEDSVLKQLLDNKLISVHDDQVELTEEGHVEATGIVRRHRLAERLLADVLDTHAFQR